MDPTTTQPSQNVMSTSPDSADDKTHNVNAVEFRQDPHVAVGAGCFLCGGACNSSAQHIPSRPEAEPGISRSSIVPPRMSFDLELKATQPLPRASMSPLSSPPLPPPRAQPRSRGDPPGRNVKLSDGYSCWNWCGYICCFGCCADQCQRYLQAFQNRNTGIVVKGHHQL
ncbi:hypothetical protein BDY24DRAFT_443800, partial [Mrakia frigida]|uniref:uncharacterized protein n=1 Tax=Mrakia frigida TaxID=29902 RepID=UPI003FCC07C4